ncbi:MAG: hypothetical protein KGO81_13670 [Bacteroidota bacterium]|nr:hypothetical protein [Bacteroidota bacterium]
MKKVIPGILLLLSLSVGKTYAQQNAPQQPPKPPSVEERLKKVNELLAKQGVDVAKQQQIDEVYKNFFIKMDKLHAGKMPPPPPPPQDEKNKPSREEMEKARKERDGQLKNILGEEQFKKWMEAEKVLRPKPPVPPSPVDANK